jgi:hypothetical protein
MPISNKDEKDLDALVGQYHRQAGTRRREDFFPLLYLPRRFKCAPEDVFSQVAFGSHDYAIDAYYIDRVGRNLYLYQFKWSENPLLFRESMDRLAVAGMQRIFGSAAVDSQKNEVLRSLRADLAEAHSLVERVYIHFVFKGDVEKAEASAGLADRKENLENKAHLVEAFFDRPVPLAVEYVADRRSGNPPQHGDSYTASFSESIRFEIPKTSTEMHVGFLRLVDLHDLYRAIGPKFLDRNIRAGLSSENQPNVKIREALTNIVLKGTDEPEYFTLNHNGITLAAERAHFSDGKVTFKVPRLLNGAQTVTSVARFLEDNHDHPTLKNGDERFSNIRVLTKIVVVDDPFGPLITKVTISNNQQNPVYPWNLRANDRIQCDLQDRFAEAGLFYSRQENAIEALSENELEDMGISDDRPINIRPLAQTFLAVQGEVAHMSHLREVFEDQKLYDGTFRKNHLSAEIGNIILVYKAGLMLSPVMRDLLGKAPQWMSLPLRRSRNLVWALLAQGILNHPKLSDHRDAWGTGLRRERDYGELLSGIACNRILPVLKQVFANDAYKDKLANNRFDFVHSKETYRRCISEADKRFNWERVSL